MAKAETEVNGTSTGGEADYSGLTSGFDLLLGGTPAPGLVIGGALIGASTRDPKIKVGSQEVTGDGTMLYAGIGVFGNYYFNPTEGPHVQLLLGFGSVDFVSSSGQSGGNDPSGLMLGVGGGYDFWVGDEWSIGPFARVLYSPTSVEEGNVKLKVNYLYPSIGVAFTLH